MSINDQFLKFYENIKLTPTQKGDAITKHSGVCKKLHDYYYPNSEFIGKTKLLIGSYAKRTHIRPARDIDVIFIMPPEKFDQYNDNQSNCQAQLLQDVKHVLREKYPTTPIRADLKVIVLEFADTKHNVELLPAWENNDGTFRIPNSANGGSWENWDPRSEIKKISDSDAETGLTRSLIRMIKKWSENCSAKIKSYKIEDSVVDFYAATSDYESDYSSLVKDFFEYLYSTTTDEDLKSHLFTAIKRSKKAYDCEGMGKFEEAASEWQKIFGADFPSYDEKNAVDSVAVVQRLEDYSHCEPLRWPFIKRYGVRLDAYVYGGNKTTKLGGINSDGRSLAKNLDLKFIAKSDALGDFQYFWQVVNTGEEARRLGGLRGDLFSGTQARWEFTQYHGKHWVECFIVRSGECIGRSGKFFINIS